MWLPTMCFGRFLSGNNFDDSRIRFTKAGRNGYGAKLSNVFSRNFTVEVKDPKRSKQFKQTWKDGMSTVGKASIKQYSTRGRAACPEDKYNATKGRAGGGCVKISMLPDYEYFGYKKNCLDEDTRNVMITHVYDLAACTNMKRVIPL